MARGENALLAWLQRRFVADAARVPIGIGDDMAAVRLDRPLVAITADMLLDGVHFDTAQHGFELIGRKALACSLSDCAAMACQPRAATVCLALAETMSGEEFKRLYEGMASLAEEFDCPIVGGDITRWSGRLAIDVCVLGEPMAPRGPVRRSDGRAGDLIYVSGPLGGSILGKHLTFTPRLDLARRLASRADLHALMDISDGLALDLYRLCTASGCDAELSAEQLDRVVSDDSVLLSQRDGRSPLDHALSDGEDFELLVIGGPDLGDQDLGLRPIGRLVRQASGGQAAMSICHPTGEREPLAPRGYEHFR